MRILWSTDTHLNLTKPKKFNDFCDSIKEKNADSLIITGDITESDMLHQHLSSLSEKLDIPIYFILGNHDYYKSSIKKTNTELSNFVNNSKKKNLFWMTEAGIIKLTEKTCLIGGENWWDGGYGDMRKQGILQELIMLQDYRDIADLAISKDKRLACLQKLTEECINHFKKVLPESLEKFDDVILMTHVPPFKESCSYQAMPLKDEWLFHFCCRALGEYLLDIMSKHSKKTLTVLCGHTHESSFFKPLANLTVIVGSASYFKPKIFTTITIE